MEGKAKTLFAVGLAFAVILVFAAISGCTAQYSGASDKSPGEVWDKAKAAAKKVEALKYNQSFVLRGSWGEITSRGEWHGEINFTNRTSIEIEKTVEGTSKGMYKTVGKNLTLISDKGTLYSTNTSVWWEDEDKAKDLLDIRKNDRINFKELRRSELKGKEVFVITLNINRTFEDGKISRYLVNRTEWISRDMYLPLKRKAIISWYRPKSGPPSSGEVTTYFYDYHLGS